MTRDDFEFNAQMSVRYHRRRSAFLERLNLILTFLTLLAGGSAFATITASRPAIAGWLSIAIVAIGLVQVVFRPEAASMMHKQWLARWTKMLREVEMSPAPDAATLGRWADEQCAIETECVGELRALQVDCWNRANRVMRTGVPPVKLRWHHRLFMQWVSFDHVIEQMTPEPSH